jgi:nicotinic acid mononucleotide adenylyltransferase
LLARGYNLTGVVIVPVYRRNPVGDRPKAELTHTYGHRVAMCQLAAGEIDGRLRESGYSVPIEVSRIAEILAERRREPNYDIETLAALKAGKCAGTELIFLMSADLVSGVSPEFGRWHRAVELARAALVALAPRPGYEPNREFIDKFERSGATFVHLNDVITTGISASHVKEQLAAGADPAALHAEGLIPASIARYLSRHPELYRGPSGA